MSINSKQADLGAIGRKTDCGKEGMEDLKYSDFSLVTKLVSQQKRGQSKSTEGEQTSNAFQGLSIPVLCKLKNKIIASNQELQNTPIGHKT